MKNLAKFLLLNIKISLKKLKLENPEQNVYVQYVEYSVVIKIQNCQFSVLYALYFTSSKKIHSSAVQGRMKMNVKSS